jgi:hypothetical protein
LPAGEFNIVHPRPAEKNITLMECDQTVPNKEKIVFFVCFYIDISLDVGSTFENQLVSNTTAVASGTVSLQSTVCPAVSRRS